MNVSNRKWVDEGGSVLQWYASGVSDGTRIQRNWLTWIVHGHVMLYMGRRGEAGWEKTWSEKHPAVTFGTPCPLMSVIRTSIIWLSLFHRSLIISLHVGTSSVVLSPGGFSDYGGHIFWDNAPFFRQDKLMQNASSAIWNFFLCRQPATI